MNTVPTSTTDLTPELLDLMEHEKVIEQGLASFVDVGCALLAIKANKKYRAAGYSSFDDYCRGRWDFDRTYGHRLIVAAQIVEMLPIGNIQPERESQVRPLTALPETERAEAWAEAVEEAGGGQPTAAAVAEVVERRKPLLVPKPLSPTGGKGHVGPPHPATFPDAVIDVFRQLLPVGATVLDPFGGVGGIHALHPEHETFAVELEQEWARVHPRTTHGDARRLVEIFDGRLFDAVATSPAYGNRLADAWYNASDPEARRTYAFDLGRPLTDGNGASMHFDTDGAYEELHAEVWAAAVTVLRPGGSFLLNCKDFQRDGAVIPVTSWHIETLTALGLVVVGLRCLPAAGLPYTTTKPMSELVVVLFKGHR